MRAADIGLLVLADEADIPLVSATHLWLHPMYSVCVVAVATVRQGRALPASVSPSLVLTRETDVAANVRRGLRRLLGACTPTVVLQIHARAFAHRLAATRTYMGKMWRQSRCADLNNAVYPTMRSCDLFPTVSDPPTRAAGPAQVSAMTRALHERADPHPSMMTLFGPTCDPHFMRESLYVLVDSATNTTRYIQRRRCSSAGADPQRRYHIDGDVSRTYKLKRVVHPPIVPADAANRPRIDAEWYRSTHDGELDGALPVCAYYTRGITSAHVCHPEQIRKYYPDASCVVDRQRAMVLWQGTRRPLREFVASHMTLDALVATCFDGAPAVITPPRTLPGGCDVLVVITSHNAGVCATLLVEMEALFASGVVDVCLVFHNPPTHPHAHDRAIQHLTSMAREAGFCLRVWPFAHNCGSDIPVFATSVRRLRDDGVMGAYAWVLKLHTKSNHAWRRSITQGFVPFLTSRQQRSLPDGCGGAACGLCGGDLYCRRYIESAFSLVIDSTRHTFAAGSVFLMRRALLLDILDDPRVCHVLRCAMVAGWYYDNTSCIENSPMHSMERLFGYLPAERGTPLHNISPRTGAIFKCASRNKGNRAHGTRRGSTGRVQR